MSYQLGSMPCPKYRFGLGYLLRMTVHQLGNLRKLHGVTNSYFQVSSILEFLTVSQRWIFAVRTYAVKFIY